MSLIKKMDQYFYPDLGDNWDNNLFREKILSAIKPGYTLLDLGAGAGGLEQMNFKGEAAQVHGADVDPVVADNPFLDSAFVLQDDDLSPLESNTYDLIYSCNVFEHIENPSAFLRGVSRVLKPGGRLIFKTPNKNHYVSLIASITPHAFHIWINEKRGRPAEHTFPTFYRMNLRRRLVALAVESGLNVVNMQSIEGRPEYLRFNVVTYTAGLIFERFVNMFGIDSLKVIIVGEFSKP